MAINVVLPKLTEWQQDVFNDVINDNGAGKTYCVKAKRQIGKTILSITCLLYFAFKDKSIGVCVQPTLAQSRRVYRQLIDAIGGEESPVIKSCNATLLEIIFVNGSQICFKSGEQKEALRGLTVKKSLLILDEAAFLDDDIFFILDPVVDATNNPTLIISTPVFRTGQFYERYQRGYNGNAYVRSYDWCEYDTSIFLPKEKLEYYRENMTPLKFKSEICGEWLDELSYVFGDFSKSIGRTEKPPIYAGIDWSQGGGNDYTVLVLLDEDGAMTDIFFWKEFSPVELIGEIAQTLNGHPTLINVTVEKNSIGHIFYDMLRREVNRNIRIQEFVTLNDSKRRIIEQLIKAFETNTITILDNKELRRELQNYGVEKLKNGGYTYNGQNGVNDDAVMALAIAYDAATGKKNNKFQFGFA